jgi:glycosyltransferase involved in cell wall biosynthesis
MRILITNNSLTGRTGTELYVRDIAIRLQERGHTPIAYSTALGDVATELHKATIPVVDDLRNLPFKPDIIHGQHHLDTMTALLSLPGVPAVYFCHGWLPWEEIPPVFPRILRYVAVDRTCLDRVLYESRIPEEKVQVLLNFVDMQRFRPRGPLPSRLKRALVFSNQAKEDNYVKTLREACAQFKIEVDVIGSSAKTATNEPEKLLPQYDLVFAKARAALEAMAVGCAVIVCDANGCGPLVSPQNFDRLRSLNFGIRALRNPFMQEYLVEQIRKYDATQAAEVSQRVRCEADLGHTTDQIVRLYEEVIEEFKQSPPLDAAAELRAAGAYFQSFSPLAKKIFSGKLASSEKKKRKLKGHITGVAERVLYWSLSKKNPLDR